MVYGTIRDVDVAIRYQRMGHFKYQFTYNYFLPFVLCNVGTVTPNSVIHFLDCTSSSKTYCSILLRHLQLYFV